MPTLTTIRKIEHVPIDMLKESEWNPNKEDRQTFDALKASIRRNGLVDPLIVRKADNSIIGGHHRLYAVRELMAEGWKLPGGTVPVIYVDISEDEAKRLNLALNKITGEPNLDKLGELLRELRDVSDADDLAATGYSPQEIEDLVALLETDRDGLIRSIEDRDKGEDDEHVDLSFRLSPKDAQTVRDELDRLREKRNLIGKDADSAALVRMAKRSRELGRGGGCKRVANG
jgi:ParB-like chromosome segregation protein Spo0J